MTCDAIVPRCTEVSFETPLPICSHDRERLSVDVLALSTHLFFSNLPNYYPAQLRPTAMPDTQANKKAAASGVTGSSTPKANSSAPTSKKEVKNTPECKLESCQSTHEVFEVVSSDDKETFSLDSCDLGSWS